MINRSTAQSLMADIWADNDNDNELKKAYFGEHPLHDEAVDTLWGLNWFANGHPQDDFGNPLPLDRLAPDERRTAQEGLKAVYPLRNEIDQRQGVALPWDRIAPDGAANINQARQKYLQNVDPVYSTALHDRNHPAHESVKAHYGAWQDWLSGAPGPAPRWGDLDPVNPYDRKAVSPLRNPWSAAALTDPGDRGLLGAGMAAARRGAATPATPAITTPPAPDGGDAAPGPLSPSIHKALSHLFAANVAGHLGIDPPKRLAPENSDDTAGDESLNGNAKAGGFKTLEYLPGRDGQPNLIAEPYRPDRDGPVKFRRVNDDGADGVDGTPVGGDREKAFEAAQGAQGGLQGQERYRAPADDETLPLDQRVAGFKQRARGFGASPEMAGLFDVFAKVTDNRLGRRQAFDYINYLGSQLGLKRAGMLFSLAKDVSEMEPGDPLRIDVLKYVESVLLNTVVDRNRPMPSMADQANIVLDHTYPESMAGGAYAFFYLNGGNERAFADAISREIELAKSLGLDTVPTYDDSQHRPGSDIRTRTDFAGQKITDLEAQRDKLQAEANRKEKAWKENRDQAAAKYHDLPTARDPLDMIARLGGGAAGVLGLDMAAGLALKTTIRTVQLARAAVANRPAWLLRIGEATPAQRAAAIDSAIRRGEIRLGSLDDPNPGDSIAYITPGKRHISQGAEPWCGPCAAAMLMDDFGIEVTDSTIKKLVRDSKVKKFTILPWRRGAGINYVAEAMKKNGLSQTQLRSISDTELENYLERGKSALIPVTVKQDNIPDGHLVVVDRIIDHFGEKYVVIRDPAKATGDIFRGYIYPYSQFKERWIDGLAITVGE